MLDSQSGIAGGKIRESRHSFLIFCMGFAPIPLPWPLIRGAGVEGHDGMAGVIELSISDADVAKLMSIA